jgi:5-hydroxyisourate hydrolase
VISTHVLDTASGRPAAGMRVRLYRAGELLRDAAADGDGRVKPLAEDAGAGVYEIVFSVGEYFGSPGGAFLGEVVVRFGAAAGEHYHVPLLVSPYGYTTYRGS